MLRSKWEQQYNKRKVDTWNAGGQKTVHKAEFEILFLPTDAECECLDNRRAEEKGIIG
jgi:hypothetical protein